MPATTPVTSPQVEAQLARIGPLADALRADLVGVRRHLHAHPEPSRAEHETTAFVTDRLRSAGLAPTALPGTGLLCDLGPRLVPSGRDLVGLRADLDALPLEEETDLPYRSTRRGVSHACGHDVHTTAVLGAGLVLAALHAELPLATGVRLVFQAAEEVHPGGAHDVMAAGGLDGVDRILSVHCDPRLDVGHIGTRIGPITSAGDSVTVTVTSPGGHTSRPHLTGDVVFALGQVITQVPAVLGRRLDPRWGVNLTWGTVRAGSVHNAIPAIGHVRGSLRCLDVRAWSRAEDLFQEAVRQVVAPYAVDVEVAVERGVPPVDNDVHATAILEAAAARMLGPESVQLTEQSLGGEDFGWYLTRIPGAMARLGTRTPGGRTYDLHQGDLRVDERAVDVGVRVLAAAVVLAGA